MSVGRWAVGDVAALPTIPSIAKITLVIDTHTYEMVPGFAAITAHHRLVVVVAATYAGFRDDIFTYCALFGRAFV